MKNKVGLAIAVVAVVAIALGAYFFLSKPAVVSKRVYKVDVKKEATQSLARYVPKNVVAFYTLTQMENVWNQLKNSKFWNDFTSLTIWQNADVQDSITNFQNQFKTSFGFELGEGTMMDLLGKELALAVLPMEPGINQPRVLFLSEVGSKTKVTERIFKIIESIRGEEEGESDIQTTTYGSSEIVQIIQTDETSPELYYTILGNSFILGIGNTREAIENAIDIVDGKSDDSFADNENYRKMIANTTLGKNAIGRFYMDFDQIGSFMNAMTALPGGAPLAPNVGDAFAVLKSLGGTTVLEEGLFTRISVVPNKDKMDDLTKTMWESKPAKPESMALIPAGTYLYTTSTSIDVKGMWDLWLSNMETQTPEQAQMIQSGIRSFEETMGLNIEKDILSWIGNEVSFVFNEVATEGIFPIPKMALVLKVKDKKSAKVFMDKILEAINKQAATIGQPQPTEEGAPAAPAATPVIAGLQLNMVEESYKGVDLNILELPFLGRALAPGYAFVGDFLVISTNTGSLQKMVDTYKRATPSIAEDEGFKSASLIMDRKTNQLVYVNMSKMMDAGIEISNWIASFQALQPDAVEAQANQQFIQESLIPLLKSLKAIKIIGVNTLYTPDGIEQTFFAEFQNAK